MPLLTRESDIERIAGGVIACDLPKSEWTHAAHLAFALWLVRREPNRIIHVKKLIQAYNRATGVANTATSGYHETITYASMRAVAAFAEGDSPETPLCVIFQKLSAAPLGAPGWLLTYWSRAQLFSVAARRRWVEPDLRPFLPETLALSSRPARG